MSDRSWKLEVLIRADLGRYAHAQAGETRARFAEEASADAVGTRRRNRTTLAAATKLAEPQVRGLENAERPLLEPTGRQLRPHSELRGRAVLPVGQLRGN